MSEPAGEDHHQNLLKSLISGEKLARDVISQQVNPKENARAFYHDLRLSGHPEIAREFILFMAFSDEELFSMLNSPPPDIDLEILSMNLDRMITSNKFQSLITVPPSFFYEVVQRGMKFEKIKTNAEVHSRLVDFVITNLHQNSAYSSILSLLDFSQFRYCQICELFQNPSIIGSAFHLLNFQTFIDGLYSFQTIMKRVLEEVKEQIQKEVQKFASEEIGEDLSRRFDRRSEEFKQEFDAQLKMCSAQIQTFREEIEKLKLRCDSLVKSSEQQTKEVECLQKEVSSAFRFLEEQRILEYKSESKSSIHQLKGCADDIVWVSVGDVLGLFPDCFELKSPLYKADLLKSVLIRGKSRLPTRWSSDPRSRDYPCFTIEFAKSIRVRISRYSLQSGFPGGELNPYVRSWRISGKFSDTPILLHEEKNTDILVDGEVHDFECDHCNRHGLNEVTFAVTGPNKLGTRQLHVGGFSLSGEVFGPRYILEKYPTVSSLLPPAEKSKKAKSSKDLITEMSEFEGVRELSSSRFGFVHLVRRRSEKGDNSELYAAKFYNGGDSKESSSAFMEQMTPFINLDHPSVMPIRGLIAPRKETGPIILTPFSECGSLEDVLEKVRKNDPPPYWNNETITKILFSLISGFEYLHSQGIIHRELKPSDIIVQNDGTAKICGYLTSYLEEHKFTKAQQVGSPFYMAPEVYDEEEKGSKVKDLKSDVFSFGLIAFEIVAIVKVFSQSMSPATIMRKVMSAEPADRPKVPDDVPGVLIDLIQRCWVPLPSKRPSFEDILRQMNAIEFRFYPDVNLRLSTES